MRKPTKSGALRGSERKAIARTRLAQRAVMIPSDAYRALVYATCGKVERGRRLLSTQTAAFTHWYTGYAGE